ncbi:MAG: bifunctional serine/threonine-protein kinase/formylglycine-generating enzyme family protein [Planctomycetota bacterium]|nr:bifunctional serine/threonine-protein kinase/formylglycine-generating enzyme family protein [Planctomycetota bacterium]
MTEELSQRVKELFHQALKLEPAERVAFLEEACGDDAPLRSHVERLLDQCAKAGSFLEVPALGEDFRLDVPGSRKRDDPGGAKRVTPGGATLSVGGGLAADSDRSVDRSSGGGLPESDLSSDTDGFEGSSPRTEKRPENTLFECSPCERLVESQFLPGESLQPRYCPWCGGPVASIPGREIDGYQIDRVIARGGFGVIYLASNVTQRKMKAVVKFLRPEMAYLQPELVKVFVEEARLTEEIGQTCWNVVRVSNVREKPWPYFFMEYVRGVGLGDLIEGAQDEKIPLEDCKGYLRGIARALHATHEHGRVHRDLKPLNIMVIQSREIPAADRIKLLDFGLAMRIAGAKVKHRAAESQTSLAASGSQPESPIQSAGTPEYMPPEAFDGRNEFAGDIYSFGVTGYQILAGERPWGEPDSPLNRLFYWRDAHKNKPPRPIRQLRPDVPKWLARVIMQCLEKEPAARVPSAEALLERLRDPLPRWVWLSGAAALILVAVLVFFAVRPVQEISTAREWEVRAAAAGELPTWDVKKSPLELWVRDERHLSRLEVGVSLQREIELDEVRSDHPDVHCRVVDEGRGVRVTFGESPELLGKSVAIRGTGSGVRLEDAITILCDADAPRVGPLRFRSRGTEAREMRPGLRLRPDGELAAEIADDHLTRVTLLVEALGAVGEEEATGPERTVTGSPPQAGEQLWRFPLSSLEEGRYRARVVAEDRAAGHTEGDAVDFRIDRSVAFFLTSSEKQMYLAGGRAFYGFLAGDRFHPAEPLGAIEVRPTGASSWTACTVHSATGISSSLELTRRLPDLKPISLDEFQVDENYLLAVRVGSLAEPLDLELRVRDTAEPANELPQKLRYEPPDARVVVERVTVKLEGESSPVALEKRGGKDRGAEYRLSPPTRSLAVEELRIELERPESVHAATCTLRSVSREGQVRPLDVVFEDLVLEANSSNAATLSLKGPLGNPATVLIFLRTDLEPPKLTVRATYADPVHKKLEDWGDVDVRLGSSEPLGGEVVAMVLGESRKGRAVEGEENVYRFDLSGLPLVEGTHVLRVEASDPAGNSSKASAEIVANLAGPRVKPLAELRDGLLLLEGDRALFDIEDRNDVDHRSAVLEVSYRAGRSGERRSERAVLGRSAGDRRFYEVLLEFLPDECDGELRLDVPDRLGLVAKHGWKFTFQRAVRLRPVVPWGGATWVRFQTREGRTLYLTRHEVSNRLYDHGDLLRQGRYVDARLGRRYEAGPKYWAHRRSCRYPSYLTTDGGKVCGDDFPVVGVSPEEAEAFARTVFGGRLPTWQEWLDAAWKENRGRYPWVDKLEGRDIANCYGSWQRQSASFKERRFQRSMDVGDGRRSVVCPVVEVSFDPLAKLAAKVRKALNYRGEFLHLIGNVGELVKVEVEGDGESDGENDYRIAGGDWDSNYEKINLRASDPWNPKRYTTRNAKTGFRVLIDPAEAPKEFLERARAAGGEGGESR